jgi:glycerate-2-kinase
VKRAMPQAFDLKVIARQIFQQTLAGIDIAETLARAAAAKLDPQDFARRSDSYNFFAALDDAIITGPTGNNLRDLRILLGVPEES